MLGITTTSNRPDCQHRASQGILEAIPKTYNGLNQRPSWDEYFQEIAKAVSLRSSCPRASVGAVITNANNRILATGYNGAPSSQLECLSVGCLMSDGHCQRAIHAEVNAVTHSNNQSLLGSKLYLYSSRGDTEPCRECKKVLQAAGVTW